ncbi:MAG TPA: hypothetical protein VLN45_09370, partial [Ignavibacteriaceae bacterium]|nr:hypothetical protein [Ignavibacteriaceae bacterium]
KLFEPIILYTHPFQKRLDVFESIFKIINDEKILCLTFNNYADWWKKRKAVSWDPEIKEDKIVVNSLEKEETISVHITFNNGKNYLSPIIAADVLSVKKINQKKMELPHGFNPDIINKKSLKLYKQDIIYKYRKLKH